MSEHALVIDPLDELRSEIEEIAQDGTLDATERSARLSEFRSDLNTLLGNIDSYLGDNEEEQRHLDDSEYQQVRKLRENADIRDELIERRIATAEQLDDLYYYSHETLDELAEEGLLEETAAHAAMIGGFMAGRKFDAKLHPRGRGGKWIDKPGGGVDFLSSLRGKRQQRPRTGTLRPKPEGGKEHRARQERQRAARETPKPEPQPEPAGRGDVYQQRRQELEQRAAERVQRAVAEGKLSDAEAHFNDAGKVSQRTLATYVDQAKTKPQTIDLYSTLNSNGERVWDQSRRELHEKIISAFLKKRRTDEQSGKPVLDYNPDAEDLQPHPDGPQVLFSGGGYAAGKGSVLKILGARGELPPDSFTLDPDQIKAELPEYQDLISSNTGGGSDPEANMHVYQEAWAISQEIQARAQDRKLNIVVDGISDTSPDEMLERSRSFTSRGYAAKAVYVDIPTEEALSRATNRALNAKDDSDRRMIPEIIMRSVHRDVASTVPSLLQVLQDRYADTPLDLEVWDNDQGKDENGQFRPPKQFLDFKEGQHQVLDEGLWQRFVNKGHETILHVEGGTANA